MQTTIRAARAFALGATCLILAACGKPYQVRVDNQSTMTVVAWIERDRSMQDDEILGRTRVRPGEEATIGPVDTDLLDPVHLVVSRPDDMRSMPDRIRLGRGPKTATVRDGTIESWNRFRVTITSD